MTSSRFVPRDSIPLPEKNGCILSGHFTFFLKTWHSITRLGITIITTISVVIAGMVTTIAAEAMIISLHSHSFPRYHMSPPPPTHYPRQQLSLCLCLPPPLDLLSFAPLCYKTFQTHFFTASPSSPHFPILLRSASSSDFDTISYQSASMTGA